MLQWIRAKTPRCDKMAQWWFFCAFAMLVSSFQSSSSTGSLAEAFSMRMEYKPPVKSSVQKLYPARGHSSDRRPSDQSASAAAGVFAPPPSRRTSFEQRMRNLVLPQKKNPSAKALNSTARRRPANVLHVETLQDYKEVVGDETEKIVAVRFYATYCKACKAVAPHFYYLATQNPNVVFVDVPVTPKNAALHQGLGVPSLPFGHIYHPQGGLVEELKLTRKHMAQFRDTLQNYVQGECDLPAATE